MSVLLLVDVVIAVLILEALALLIFGRRKSRLPRFGVLAPNLAAGLFLVLALRCALRGDGLPVIAGCLAFAGLAHALDLRLRSR
jgi:hypothetical protein